MARHVVGRAARCDLLLSSPRVSGEHAVLLWTTRWEVRDLGSRNGTFVGGRRLGVGEVAVLPPGAILSFGGPSDSWVLDDAGAPEPMAVWPDGSRATGRSGMLALPSVEEPLVTLYQDSAGRWVSESDQGRVPVLDGQTIEVGPTSCTLRLPEVLPRTSAGEVRQLADTCLRFTVSHDEEYVRLALVDGSSTLDLGSRAYHYLLLTLARARLDDHGSGVELSAQGWVYQDVLVRQLRVRDALLNNHVHRARTQLSEAGVTDAVELVQRRPSARQLRLGTVNVEIIRG